MYTNAYKSYRSVEKAIKNVNRREQQKHRERNDDTAILLKAFILQTGTSYYIQGIISHGKVQKLDLESHRAQ